MAINAISPYSGTISVPYKRLFIFVPDKVIAIGDSLRDSNYGIFDNIPGFHIEMPENPKFSEKVTLKLKP